MLPCENNYSEQLYAIKMTPQLGQGSNPNCCMPGLICAGGIRTVPPYHQSKEETLIRKIELTSSCCHKPQQSKFTPTPGPYKW
jgi:hypothetical protein